MDYKTLGLDHVTVLSHGQDNFLDQKLIGSVCHPHSVVSLHSLPTALSDRLKAADIAEAGINRTML